MAFLTAHDCWALTLSRASFHRAATCGPATWLKMWRACWHWATMPWTWASTDGSSWSDAGVLRARQFLRASSYCCSRHWNWAWASFGGC
jgi:hypothetical protein